MFRKFYQLLYVIVTSLSFLLFWLSIIANYQDFLESTLVDLIEGLSLSSYLACSFGPIFLVLEERTANKTRLFFSYTLLMIFINIIFYLYSRLIMVLTLPYSS